MSQFLQKLNIQNNAVSALLLQLQDLTGLVYLHDQNFPIIAFLPKAFLKFQQSTLTQFHQIEFNQYQISQDVASVIEFSNFNHSQEYPEHDISFHGGYIGFFSYDYSADQFIDVLSHPQPSFFLGEYSTFLKFQDGAWYFYSDEKQAQHIYESISSLLSQAQEDQSTALQLLKKCAPRWSQAQYFAAFNRVQEYIKAGDCYQINLTQEFKATAQGDRKSVV